MAEKSFLYAWLAPQQRIFYAQDRKGECEIVSDLLRTWFASAVSGLRNALATICIRGRSGGERCGTCFREQQRWSCSTRRHCERIYVKCFGYTRVLPVHSDMFQGCLYHSVRRRRLLSPDLPATVCRNPNGEFLGPLAIEELRMEVVRCPLCSIVVMNHSRD